MSTQTYYTVLGLAPDAPSEVIRAAYKALALRYHPDKTIHHSAEERAKSAAIFRQVQEAWDVLGNVDLKAHYDIKLEEEESDFPLSSTSFSSTNSGFSSKFKRSGSTQSSHSRTNSTILTTPMEKATIRANLRQQMTKLAEDRAKRDQEDSTMPLYGLKYTLEIWKELLEENKDSALDRAYCQIKIFEYEKKVQIREQEKEDWLASMAGTKSGMGGYGRHDGDQEKGRHTHEHGNTPTSTSTSAHRASTSARCAPPSTPTTTIKPHPQPRPTAPNRTHVPSAFELRRKKAEEEQAAQDASRAALRAGEKARADAAKQSYLLSKAESVRSEKEKLRLKAEEAARKEAERIARVKAKVAPKLKAENTHKEKAGRVDTPTTASARKRECRMCGSAHGSIAEWKKCSMQVSALEIEDEAFATEIGSQ